MMLKYRLTNAILLLVFSIIFFSCELGDSPSEEDLESLPNNWVIEKVLIDGIEDNSTNYSNFLLSFSQDESYYLQDIYGMKEQGTWSVANGSQLILTPNQGESREYVIVSIAKDRLVLLFKDKYFKEVESSFEYTLVPE